MEWKRCTEEQAPAIACKTLKLVGVNRIRRAENLISAELGLVCLSLLERVEQLEKLVKELSDASI